MKKLLTIACLVLAMATKGKAQQLTLCVTNPSSHQRQEVVEAPFDTIKKRLGLAANEQLVVKNTIGQQQIYQCAHDGKLLVYVTVLPHSTAELIISKGQPEPFRSFVFGRVYPERIDDLAWENDRSAYRIYGPALQRNGEKSFGTDVWTKSTQELVVENRYKKHLWGVALRDSLRKTGQKQQSNDTYIATSFHHDHGDGMDVYSVGATLGCGAPALMKAGQLVFPYCYKDYKILDNGPLRFTVELTYHPNADGIVEHRLITLDRGSHYNRCTVWYEGIKQPMAWASGVVLNGDGELALGKEYVLYADPTDNPKLNQSQIYVGTLFPNGINKTTILKGNKNHGLGILRKYQGQRYTYYFGSAWSCYDVRTMEAWKLLSTHYLQNIKNPLIIAVK